MQKTVIKYFYMKLGEIWALIIVLVFISLIQLKAQNPQSSAISTICSSKDYNIKIGSQFYDADHNLGFICVSDLPVVISLYKKSTNQPITATDIVWTGSIDSTYGTIYEALIAEAHFNGTDELMFSVKFTENGVKEEIKNFKISKDLKVVALQKYNSSDFFDDVRDDSTGQYIMQYWPSHTPSREKPWIFVPSSGNQNVKLSVRNKQGKKGGRDIYKAVDVDTEGNGATITPSTFAGDDSNFSLGQSISTNINYPFINSCNLDTVLYIYSQPRKTYNIEFHLLCETDDDIQTALGVVPSNTSICISPGPDGYIDEILRPGGPTYMSPLDTVITITGNRYIVAGRDSICQTKVHKNSPPKCSKARNIPQIMNELNSLYNPIDVHFIANYYDTLFFSYNLYKEDDSLSVQEQRLMRSLLNNSNIESNKIVVLLVDKITKSGKNIVLGRATTILKNTNHLSLSKEGSGFVLGHEIGHATFALLHPDDDLHLKQPGDNPPNLGPFKVNDDENFMFSNANIINLSKIRQYQWKKIHTGEY